MSAGEDVVLCGVARTPVGRFRGALSALSAVELGVLALRELLSEAGIDAASGIIEDVLFGHVLQAGCGQAPARQVALGAGLPNSTPATTINKVCGSSLKAVMLAASSIRAGEYSVIAAGGMESMSNAPHFAHRISRTEYGEMRSTLVHDGLWDVYNDEHMGSTGETVSDEFDISRRRADTFSVRSHALAKQAWDEGWMEFEAFTVGELSRDEGIRGDVDADSLAALEPAFADDGRVTAGNSSQLSDGASAVLVASRSAAEAHGWPVLATLLDQTTSGVEPARVMAAPIPAIETLLARNDLTMEDLTYVEHNEAFAAASCAVAQACSIPDEKFNPHGGAVAIGHPLGATGARCLMTLVNALRRAGGGTGIVTICLGGGNAVAMLVETT